MLPAVIFGMTALGMVIVPVGFQLLAVLGGKALLLSKMALILATINGLKKVRIKTTTENISSTRIHIRFLYQEFIYLFDHH